MLFFSPAQKVFLPLLNLNMSRHNQFFNDLKHGEYDEDYDEDYDDDDYYEDEYDYSVQAKQGGSKKPEPKTSASAKKPTTDKNGISTEEPDYDFIIQVFGAVRAAVGPMISTQVIVDALRKYGYDTKETIAKIKESKGAAKHKPLVLNTADTTEGMMRTETSTTFPRTESETPSQTKSTNSTAPSKVIVPVEYKGAEVAKDTQGKEGLTIVITGHVDSGKSTILGHMLLQKGYFSNTDVKKNEALGSSSGKSSFKYAWLLDQSEEERRRGVTIDSGAHGFETETKRVTVLDAPGHIDYITNMISSATQADAALLVVTVRPGEFESGLEKGTREHLVVLHTLGIRSIIVAMNKMDIVDYSQERFEEVKAKLMVEVLAARFEASDVKAFVPVSGLLGINLIEVKSDSPIPWYTGPSLFEAFDSIVVGERFLKSPTRISIQDVQRSVVYGRIESGTIKKGDKLLFVPSNLTLTVKSITLQAGSVVSEALAGASVELTLSEEAIGISAGDVGCAPKYPVPYSNEFEATISVFPNAKKALLPGARFLLCIHATVISATIATLKSRRTKDGTWVGGMVKAVAPDSQAIVRIRTDRPLALEQGEGLRALGVFVMRQDDETIGGGIVKEVLPVSF